ncbi:glycosyltransferase [Thermodesulfobacteriota bacterium]
MASPFVSVIIPVYNDTVRLKSCLHALEKQTYPPESYEVIVVDNGSDHPIESVISDFTHARSALEPDRGSYKARNRGIALSKGIILAFTDADCIPSSNWIERGALHLKNSREFGIIGGKIEFFFRNPGRPSAIELYDSMFHLNNKQYIQKENFSVTANMFVRKNIMDKVGSFDHNLKSSGDKDWGNRAAFSDFKLLYAEDVIVSHPARHSFVQLRKKSVRIVEGLKDMRRKQSLSPKNKFQAIFIALLPPFITVIRVGLSNRMRVVDIVKVIFISLALQYFKVKGLFGSTTD